MKRAMEIGKAVARNVLPPILANGLRYVRDRIRYGPSRMPPAPPPLEYSTLDAAIEIPCQVECYLLCRENYVRAGDAVLDVGLGLGYGLQILAAKAERLAGIDVDAKAVERGKRIFSGHPRVKEIAVYDGNTIPFADKSFDVVTCVEVIEHVPDYDALLRELARVARRCVFLTTPNRRPEYTLPDGRPRNYWHIREWSKEELEAILQRHHYPVVWHFLSAKTEAHPQGWTQEAVPETWTLVPVIRLD
jgi:ubiquinone/menaquinone biosynthesis C-methylase UbiE